MLRAFLFLTACVAVNNVQATLITESGYTLNTNTNIVTGGGLEWLQWDETVGLSINDVMDPNSQFAQEGWTVASNQNMAMLFTDWGFGPSGHVWDVDDNTIQGVFDVKGSYMDLTAFKFSNLFGFTSQNPPLTWDSAALFGSDSDNDGLFSTAIVRTFDNPSYSFATGSSSIFADDDPSVTSDTSFADYGVALVRTPVKVPEPGSLALALIAIGGLIARKLYAG